MILPSHGASGIPREAAQWQAGQAREPPLDSDVAPGRVDNAQRLVKPDRHTRAHAQDEAVRDLRLGLGQGRAAGVLLIPAHADRLPREREVAVEIHAVSVLSRAGVHTVRIEIGQQP